MRILPNGAERNGSRGLNAPVNDSFRLANHRVARGERERDDLTSLLGGLGLALTDRKRLEVLEHLRHRLLTCSESGGADALPHARDPQPVVDEVAVEQAILDQRSDRLVPGKHGSDVWIAGLGRLGIEVVGPDRPRRFGTPIIDPHFASSITSVASSRLPAMTPPLSASATERVLYEGATGATLSCSFEDIRRVARFVNEVVAMIESDDVELAGWHTQLSRPRRELD